MLKNTLNKIVNTYNKTCLEAVNCLDGHSDKILLGLGTILLFGGLNSQAHAAAGGAGQACGILLQYMEGAFGALIATGAGIGAIVAAALGGFKAAWTLVVVSVGSFILRSYLSLFHTASCVSIPAQL